MSEQSVSPIRLLLVDDEPDFLTSSVKALARRGFEVATAPDGRTALQMLAAQSFDVVVLDVKMPGMDGVDVFRQISAHWPHLPVIVLTGQATMNQSFEVARLGVFAYLDKPCDVEKLAETIRRAAEIERNTILAAPDRSQFEKIRLLLVDDEPEFLQGLSRTLGRRGMKVTTAGSGAEALDELRRQEFDVAVLDVKMPGIGGIDLLQRIKQEFPQIQILLLTGHPTMDQALKGMELGAFDYLLKPQDIDSLSLKILCAYLQGREPPEKD